MTRLVALAVTALLLSGASARADTTVTTPTVSTWQAPAGLRQPTESVADYTVRSSKCYDDSTPADQSSLALNSYEQQLAAWISHHDISNRVGPPHFPSCHWRFADAVTATGYFNRAEDIYVRESDRATSALMSQARAQQTEIGIANNTNFNTVGLLASIGEVAIIILIARLINRPVKALSTFEKRLVADGAEDMWAEYRDFMIERTAKSRRLTRGILFTIPFIGILGLLAKGPLGYATVVGAVGFWAAFPILFILIIPAAAAEREAISRNMILVPGKNKLRPASPKPEVRGEHGSATHAAHSDLIDKGFAERES